MRRNRLCILLLLVLSIVLIAGCAKTQEESFPRDGVKIELPPDKADEIYDTLTLEEKVCQLVIARDSEGDGTPFAEVVAKYPVGGVCMFGDSFKGLDAQQVKAKTAQYHTYSKIPMLVSVDEEGGTVVRASRNKLLRSSKFKSPSELYNEGGYDRIKADTAEKSQFLRNLGINVNFAPVADVVTDEKGFLYKRAFGKGTTETAKYVETVVAEMNVNKVGSFVKHFPGYGNSSGDTHLGMDVNNKSLEELEKVDLPPFQAGFNAGADGVMVTHTIINALDNTIPASLSPKVCDYIRTKMGFDGLIITDGLDMAAITDYCGGADPALKAILAGADIALIPFNADESCQALIDAANEGILTEERIEESVKRILRLKLKLGILE